MEEREMRTVKITDNGYIKEYELIEVDPIKAIEQLSKKDSEKVDELINATRDDMICCYDEDKGQEYIKVYNDIVVSGAVYLAKCFRNEKMADAIFLECPLSIIKDDTDNIHNSTFKEGVLKENFESEYLDKDGGKTNYIYELKVTEPECPLGVIDVAIGNGEEIEEYREKEVYREVELGKKNDSIDGKVRMDLLPLEMLTELAKVYQAGAEKYGVDNWRKFKLEDVSRLKGALLRHLVESESKDKDDETGCYHLMQVAWNAITMLWLKLNKE